MHREKENFMNLTPCPPLHKCGEGFTLKVHPEGEPKGER